MSVSDFGEIYGFDWVRLLWMIIAQEAKMRLSDLARRR